MAIKSEKKLPSELFKELMDSMSPSDVLGLLQHIGFELPRKNLKHNGKGWVEGLLMSKRIQQDSKPSVAANVFSGALKDFGSQWSGDICTAIMEAFDLRYPEAVEWAYNMMRVPIPEDTGYHNLETSEKWEWWKTEHSEKVAEYQYHDASGAYVYRIDRMEGKFPFKDRKSFPSYYAGSQKTKGIAEEDRVLYRLPGVVKATQTGENVFIVEGEKDVDTLASEGFTATCNMGGAGTWLKQYNEHLRGVNAIVLPDYDRSGIDHAAMLVRELTGICHTIWVCFLPGLVEKGDVTDWIDLGNTKDDLITLVRAGDMQDWIRICRMQPDEWVKARLIDILDRERRAPVTAKQSARVASMNRVLVEEMANRLHDANEKLRVKIGRIR